MTVTVTDLPNRQLAKEQTVNACGLQLKLCFVLTFGSRSDGVVWVRRGMPLPGAQESIVITLHLFRV